MFPGYRFIFVPAGYPGEAKPMLPIQHFYPKTSTACDLWEERALGRKAKRKKTARNFWRDLPPAEKGRLVGTEWEPRTPTQEPRKENTKGTEKGKP